jgi:phosphoribosylanthranilate isomerase
VEAYLLDTPTPEFGGSGQTFDWSRAQKFPFRTIVAGGLDGSNVAGAIATLQPWGVDACSRIESRPGKKDEVRMKAFIRAALEGSEPLRLQEIGSL